MDDKFQLDDEFIDELVAAAYSDMLISVKGLAAHGYCKRRSVNVLLQYLADKDLPLVVRDPMERLIMKIESSDMPLDMKEIFYALIIDDDIKHNGLEELKNFYIMRKNAFERIKQTLERDNKRTGD